LDRRQEEAHASIVRLQDEQRSADERLTLAQRRLLETREATEDLSRRAAEARAAHAGMVERAAGLTSEVQRLEEAAAELNVRAAHAGMVERAAGLTSEVQRLEEAAAELNVRAASLAAELEGTRRRVEELGAAIVAGAVELDANVRTLDGLRADVQAADDLVSG